MSNVKKKSKSREPRPLFTNLNNTADLMAALTKVVDEKGRFNQQVLGPRDVGELAAAARIELDLLLNHRRQSLERKAPIQHMNEPRMVYVFRLLTQIVTTAQKIADGADDREGLANSIRQVSHSLTKALMER